MSGSADKFIDAIGHKHVRAGSDARIVSLVPSITELVADLGLTDQLVGRTKWCIHPERIVDAIPSIGGTKKINLAKLRALNPSHVIVNIDENTREMVDTIAEEIPNIIVTHPIGPRDNLELYRLIGGIFGRDDRAESLCQQFEDAYQNLADAAKTLPVRRVLYLIWKDPWMTVSRGTYIARTLELVRWQTADRGDERYPRIEIDAELLANTDLVLFSSEPFTFTKTHLAAFAEAHGFAVEKLLLVDGEMTSWYGSRAILGLEYLGDIARRCGADAL